MFKDILVCCCNLKLIVVILLNGLGKLLEEDNCVGFIFFVEVSGVISGV